MTAGPIKGLIFDKDGTLFDFNATWGAWAEGMLAAETGGDPALFARLAAALGYDPAARLFRPGSVVIAATAEEVAATIMPITGENDRAALLSRMNAAAATVAQIEAVPLKPFCEGLHELGLTLGVVTNDAEAPARAHLGRAGITGYFDFIAGYDSGHGAKPDPGQLLAFAVATGLDPAACIMVGDSTHDLRAGAAAGMRRVGVLTGPARMAELAPEADVVLPDIGHIPGWLQDQGLI